MPSALHTYERIRKPRTTYIARNTRVLQEWLHLYDGPERNRRDEMMKGDHEGNPMFWGYSKRKDWLFGYDASAREESDIPALPPMPRRDARVYERNKNAWELGGGDAKL